MAGSSTLTLSAPCRDQGELPKPMTAQAAAIRHCGDTADVPTRKRSVCPAMRPTEGVVAVSVGLEVGQPSLALVHCRQVSVGHGPDHQLRRRHRLKPLCLAAVEAFVDRLEDEGLELLHAGPDAHAGDDDWICERAKIDRSVVAAVANKAPDKARHPFRHGVDPAKIVDELRHARIVERIAEPRDVKLGNGHPLPRYYAWAILAHLAAVGLRAEGGPPPETGLPSACQLTLAR